MFMTLVKMSEFDVHEDMHQSLWSWSDVIWSRALYHPAYAIDYAWIVFFIFTLLFLWSLCLICTNAICNAIKVKKKNSGFDTKGMSKLLRIKATDMHSMMQSLAEFVTITLLW